VTPDKREQIVAAALRGGLIPTDTNELVQELLDTREVLADSLNSLQSVGNERDYLKRLRDDAYANHRVQLDAARLRYEDRIDGLLAQIRRLEAGR